MIEFQGMSQEQADAYRQGASDAYGNLPERQISAGGAPCRCCLRMIDAGEDMLVLAYRPFSQLQPYAETGPVFLCATPCSPEPKQTSPAILQSPDYLLKAYSRDERIIYGTGQVTEVAQIAAYAEDLLQHKDVAFVDLRSARNNCWQARITRRSER